MRVSFNTTPGLMGAVACIAVALGGYVAYESNAGSASVGLAIVLASTAAVAALFAAESNAQNRADGQNLSGFRRSTIILGSCGLAILVVGLADSAFVATYALIVGGPRFFPFTAAVRARHFLPEGLVGGTAVAVAVCYLSRRGFSRSTSVRARFRCRLGLLAVAILLAILLLVMNVIDRRFAYRQEQAQWHGAWASIYYGETGLPEIFTATEARARAQRAEYHSRMKRKWEYAALRFWLPVAPDPRPPEPGLVQ
jgi:hypothetical protein